MLPGLSFPNVREHSLRDIWFDSEGFNRYRGTGWMKEPCTSCEFREQDLGGCRCQAFMLANDPAAADPVCVKSPHHQQVVDAVAQAAMSAATAANGAARGVREQPLVFRNPVNSRRLGAVLPSSAAAPLKS
jgi:pyrroloquinoline quinone biosynthesis protein E